MRAVAVAAECRAHLRPGNTGDEHCRVRSGTQRRGALSAARRNRRRTGGDGAGPRSGIKRRCPAGPERVGTGPLGSARQARADERLDSDFDGAQHRKPRLDPTGQRRALAGRRARRVHPGAGR